jgi:hypothetical protein
MAREVEKQQRGGGLSARHGMALVVVGVVGVLIAFWALSAIAGLIWGLVKAAVIVAVVLGVLYVLLRRRR